MSAGSRGARRALATAIAFTLLAPACAGRLPAPGQGSGTEVVADSVTIALYRFDETGGTRIGDSGPFRLDGAAGTDTRTDFGRNRNARRFGRSFDSFALVPWNPVLDSRALTIEAWVWLDDYSAHEDATIASRWDTGAERSWLLAVRGRDLDIVTGPREHAELMQQSGRGLLLFAYQPDDAGATRVFYSARPIELQRWTRLAVTVDGQIVRIYLDGLLDSNYAVLGGVRASRAPLLIGNWFDTRQLTDFGGDLRHSSVADLIPHYALQGALDDLRISSVARTPESLTDGH